MTRYEAIEKALRELATESHRYIDLYESPNHLVAFAINKARAALALPEDRKTANAELYAPTVSVEWISEVFPDWTTLQIMANGTAFAFNRLSGKVYKIPDPNVPFIQMTEPYKVVRDGDKVRFE